MFDDFKLRYSDQRTLAFACVIALLLLGGDTITRRQETLESKQYQFRIDLNTVTRGELQTLPGIGPKIAESIIQYRDQHVPIQHAEELLNVRGIGPKRYAAMKPYFID